MASLLPTSEPAKRISALFKRRVTTPWSTKEVEQFKLLFKSGNPYNEDEWLMVERYYTAERNKSNGVHRRDLKTFLNNMPSEFDRAVAWCEAHPIRSKVVKFSVVQKEEADWTPEQVAKHKAQFADFKNTLRGQGSANSG